MEKERGGVLLQVITTAAISLILVSSITLMLRNYSKKAEIDGFIKKRNLVASRVANFLAIPDILLASGDSLPGEASGAGSDLYGNYMLSQCLGLSSREADTYRGVTDDAYYTGTDPGQRSGSDLVLRDKTCLLRDFGTGVDEDTWYPLLLIGTKDYQDSAAAGNSCVYEESSSKWGQDLDCFLAGQTWGNDPSQQVAYSFKGAPNSLDQSHPLSTFVYFRPFCDDDGLEASCYVATRMEFKYKLEHVWNSDDLEDCEESKCEKNSPIKLGTYPKQEDFFIELTAADILGNQCNPNARVQVSQDGGIECSCLAPYRQLLKEKGGELFYKKNHKGPLCELMDPMCQDGERLVGQTPDGIPICERFEEDIVDSASYQKETYQFVKTFFSTDSPIYSDSSGAKYANGICDSETADSNNICNFYSCRYQDKDADGVLQESERVDGWVNNLDINCQSYLKFEKMNTHDMYPSVSYFEELVWDITESTAAVILALSDNALWIPKLLTSPSEVDAPKEYSIFGRQDLVFPNVGERLSPNTDKVNLYGRDLNIPFCNAKRILADNAPDGAAVRGDPRCPLVVCEYTMTCQYAASARAY